VLLRNRISRIEAVQAPATEGQEHLPATAIAVISWLGSNRIEYVLVGPVARAIRGDSSATGPVAIVAAPYGRNLDRLARALSSARARLRTETVAGLVPADTDSVPVKLNAEKLLRAERWALRLGEHELDVEGRPAGSPRYQELLYESSKFELAPDVSVEVAAPEDIEHYDHVRRTGVAPEITVSRGTGLDPTAAPPPDSQHG
jgi:hypothetical protein